MLIFAGGVARRFERLTPAGDWVDAAVERIDDRTCRLKRRVAAFDADVYRLGKE